MTLRRIQCLLLLVPLLSACASRVPIVDFYEADAEALRRFPTIAVVSAEHANSAPFSTVGEIEGLYCERGLMQEDIEGERARLQAEDQLRLKAAALGATHISEPDCTARHEVDWSNNCMGTLTCRSDALQAQ